MASGCILGNCIYCNEIVWEDEDYRYSEDNKPYHYKCECQYPYVKALRNEIERLKQENEELKSKLIVEKEGEI